MSSQLSVLLIAAFSLGFFHTLLGPDHYLPFIVMSKSGNWSLRKTVIITFLCGLGHIMSSVFLGIIGVSFGIAVTKLEAFESFRGNIAAWALITFGLIYFIWGVKRALRNQPHQHFHSHGNGIIHEHTHTHNNEHIHVHAEEEKKNMTPWILFTIFVFGPCEPLIPILMYPAAKGSINDLILVTLVFGLVTITTMMTIVLVSIRGINFIPLSRFSCYSHALAGATIFLCGIAIQFLGL
ncbi:MAG: sulfite exporter TauE/SafE family protein [Candidatus Cloacimonetes bacterium]|nr:sulfite exporter TauE/SafE family protein [Candidatus Cloacimonadota bacterium]